LAHRTAVRVERVAHRVAFLTKVSAWRVGRRSRRTVWGKVFAKVFATISGGGKHPGRIQQYTRQSLVFFMAGVCQSRGCRPLVSPTVGQMTCSPCVSVQFSVQNGHTPCIDYEEASELSPPLGSALEKRAQNSHFYGGGYHSAARCRVANPDCRADPRRSTMEISSGRPSRILNRSRLNPTRPPGPKPVLSGVNSPPGCGPAAEDGS
jgi:hypothetical protein